MKKISLIAIVILLASCESDNYRGEMEQTLFIPDPYDKNLPAYTEWGYNSFGALYERMYLYSTYNIVPCKVIMQNGIMTFSLNGRYSSSYSQWGAGDDMTLNFSFPISEPMTNYKDLLRLHQMHFDLTSSSVEIKMMQKGSVVNMTILSGNLHFKRAHLIRLDDQEDRVALSGTFEISFLRNGMPEIISKGRFDVGISHLFVLP